MSEYEPVTLEPEAQACLDETRSSVLNVMVVEGAAIAISGWALGRLDQGIWEANRERVWRVAIAVLFVILIGSRILLRVGASRSALRNPVRRATRFFRAHLLSAMVGAIAVPLGIVYGWAVQPTLSGIAPFWIVALGVGFLSLPRSVMLEGFDEPIPALSKISDSPAEIESQSEVGG